MARTEDTPLSVILSSLGEGVASVPQAYEQQREKTLQNLQLLSGLQNQDFAQNMERQRLQMQKEQFGLDTQIKTLQMDEINQKIRELAIKNQLTPELQHKYDLERDAEKIKLQNAGKLRMLQYAIANKVTTSGRSAMGGGTDPNAKTVENWVNRLMNATNQNIDAMVANARAQNDAAKATANLRQFNPKAEAINPTLVRVPYEDFNQFRDMMRASGLREDQINLLLLDAQNKMQSEFQNRIAQQNTAAAIVPQFSPFNIYSNPSQFEGGNVNPDFQNMTVDQLQSVDDRVLDSLVQEILQSDDVSLFNDSTSAYNGF